MYLVYIQRLLIHRGKYYKVLYIFTMWPYWPYPRVLTPDPGIMYFKSQVYGSMGIITMHLVFFIYIYIWE